MVAAILPAILGLAGSFIGGSQSNQAASSAAQGETQLTAAQAQMIQGLMDQFTKTFQPLQNQTAGQYSSLTGAMPNTDIVKYTIGKLLSPYFNPYQENATRQQNIVGLKDSLNQIVQALGPAMSPTQMMGIVKNLGEKFLTGDVASNINMAGTNIAQTNSNATTAMNAILNMIGAQGQFSGLGMDQSGQAISGTQGLIGDYAAAGTNAANTAAANNPTSSISALISKYLAGSPGSTPAAGIGGSGNPYPATDTTTPPSDTSTSSPSSSNIYGGY